MLRLKKWTARRSGARITIEGQDDKGVNHRVSVEEIAAGSPYPVASAADGRNVELLPA